MLINNWEVIYGIPKAYNRWYSQYKSTRHRDLIIYTVGYLKVNTLRTGDTDLRF